MWGVRIVSILFGIDFMQEIMVEMKEEMEYKVYRNVIDLLCGDIGYREVYIINMFIFISYCCFA